MDIYLRQSWRDRRLNLSQHGVSSTVTINGEDIMSKIWKPDLFFRNVKDAKFHHVTVPNKLVKIGLDGEVLFSMRLTLRLACFMSFRHFPLDTQRCHILLGPCESAVHRASQCAEVIHRIRRAAGRFFPMTAFSPRSLPADVL